MNLIKLFSLKKTPFIFFCLNLSLYLLVSTSVSQAQTIMSNDQYEIHQGNLNSFSGKITDSNFKLGTTGGNFAPGTYSGQNYTITTGLPSTTSVKPFSFSISSLFVDFGPLNPGAPVTRTNIIDVSAGSANGYSVLAYQDHPLQDKESKQIIADSTCDDGTCDEAEASTWSNILTFGVAYRCDNIEGFGCLSDFDNKTYFKQFSSLDSKEKAQPIMRSRTPVESNEAEITYKINIPPTQASGVYENTITYIAIPSL